MGAYVSTGVHYREDGRCKAALVVGDNPPNYDELDLVVVDIVEGAEVRTVHQDVQNDTADPPDTDGTFHYIGPADANGF